jgi:hypothetical protein
MNMALSERLINRITRRDRVPREGRRGFLAGAAVAGAALAVNPWGFLVRNASAYDAVCGSAAACSDGYSVFCCTINDGLNSCPPDSFIGGWWKADASSFCGGSARYYIDCNAYRDGAWKCSCASGTCDSRRVACNQFRYGQCNLDIPYSNTGPVVCRIVSCTPPWQQYGGVCTTSSATDQSTASHSAPCVGTPPRGALESAVVVGTSIRVRGYAFDPDQPATSLTVAVQINGVTVTNRAARVARPDIDKAFGITGNHGFDITVPAKAGRSTVAVHAVNIAGGRANTLLGSKALTVAPPAAVPIGHVESVTPVTGGLLVKGWTFDKDQPSTSLSVDAYRDGRIAGRYRTAVPRPDVNHVYRVTGNHGFEFTIAATAGRHEVDVYGLNVGAGTRNPLLGSARATVADRIPVGRLDSAVATARGVVLTGWAFDGDNPGTPISVAVYRDDIAIHWYPTGLARPDVNRIYRITGNHGFSITVPTAPGSHRFTVHGINTTRSGRNPVLGSATVVVPR